MTLDEALQEHLEKEAGLLSGIFRGADLAGKVLSSPIAGAHAVARGANAVSNLPGLRTVKDMALKAPAAIANNLIGKPIATAGRLGVKGALGVGAAVTGLGKGIASNAVEHMAMPAARFVGRSFAKAPVSTTLAGVSAYGAGGQIIENARGKQYAHALQNVYNNQPNMQQFGRRLDPTVRLIGDNMGKFGEEEMEKEAVSMKALHTAMLNRAVRQAKDPAFAASDDVRYLVSQMAKRPNMHWRDHAADLGVEPSDVQSYVRMFNKSTKGQKHDTGKLNELLNKGPYPGMGKVDPGPSTYAGKKSQQADAAQKNKSEFTPARMLGLLGLGTVGAGLFSPTAKTMGEKLQKKVFPNAADRVNTEDEVAKAEAKGLGEFHQKQVTRKLERARKQKEILPAAQSVINTLAKKDSIIAEAHKDPRTRDIIHQTMNTVYSFGPDVAKDHRAMQSILREAISAPDGGLSFQTVKQIAETQKNIAQGK